MLFSFLRLCQRTGHASSALFAIHKQYFASTLEQFQIGMVAWLSVATQRVSGHRGYLTGRNFFWHPKDKSSLFQVSRLCDLSEENNTVTSVSWSERVSLHASAWLIFDLSCVHVSRGSIWPWGRTRGRCRYGMRPRRRS